MYHNNNGGNDLKDKQRHYKKYLNLRTMIAESAEKFGDKTYLRYFDNDKNICDLSFADFAKKVASLATCFHSLEDTPSRIAILSENRYEWVIAYAAAISSGKVAIPLDKELQFSQAAAFLRIAEADTIFYSAKFADNVRDILSSDSNIRHFICFDNIETDGDKRFMTFDSCISAGAEAIANGDTSYYLLRTDSGRMCEIIFTSGTTGTSKGVMLSEDNLMTCIHASANMVNISDKDTILSVLPFHHTYEACCGILTPICLGTTVCINNSLKYVTRNLKIFKPTGMVLVPLFVTTINKKINDEIRKENKEKLIKGALVVTNTARKAGIDLRRVAFKKIHESLGGNLRTIICGGAALDPELVKRFDELGISIAQGYGITECAPLVSVSPYRHVKPASVGLPIEGSVVKIVGSDENGNDIDLPTGEIGEICVKGPHVMLGYFNNPEATKEAFNSEGFFRTGDYGYIDSDGYIYITGRKKNIIIFENGKNVYPEEIEEYLSRCELINECAVVARKVDGEDLITAVIFPNYDMFAGKTDDEIKSEIKKAVLAVNKTLPSFKQIRNVEIKKSEFEKTTTKKIIRSKI